MPTVFYDADCSMCTNGARRFGPMLVRRGISLEPLQAADACARLRIRDAERLSKMRFRLDDGTVFGGAAAVAEVARRIWWAWPAWAISRLPGMMWLMDAAYGWVARHRGCVNGACRVDTRSAGRTIAILPLAVLPVIAWNVRSRLSAWAFMWTMALALFAGCKWLTYRGARRTTRSGPWRALEYLLAWPGMDADAFLAPTSRDHGTPRTSEWAMAVFKTTLGAILIAGAARIASFAPMRAGWLAMAGFVLLLHFGTFHLASLFWRHRGVNARPVMRNPLRSRSLAEFWGRRWNTAFHELVARFTFQPLRSRIGASAAALLVFMLSGAVHELVISVPARAGYGLPTGYFVLQGIGIAGERSATGRRLGLGHGWRGWLFTIVVAGGPAYWLFPPTFVHRVVLPMLAVIRPR